MMFNARFNFQDSRIRKVNSILTPIMRDICLLSETALLAPWVTGWNKNDSIIFAGEREEVGQADIPA